MTMIGSRQWEPLQKRGVQFPLGERCGQSWRACHQAEQLGFGKKRCYAFSNALAASASDEPMMNNGNAQSVQTSLLEQ
jgi:hypothetical protein